MPRWRIFRTWLWLMLAILLALVDTVRAAAPTVLTEEETGPLVHYAYSSLLGTGVYQLADRTVYVFRAPFSWQVRSTDTKEPGLRFMLPLTVGLHDFDFRDLDKILDARIGTITAVPGIEMEFRPRPQWSVRPAIYAGIGFDITNNETSFVHAAALRSVYELDTQNPRISIGAEGLLSGYAPETGQSKFLTRFGLGLDTIFPTDWQLGKGRVFINPQLIGYAYLKEMSFETIGQNDIGVRGEFQIGLAIGRNPAIEIFGFPVERAGIAYRRGPHLKAIVFIYDFPFHGP